MKHREDFVKHKEVSAKHLEAMLKRWEISVKHRVAKMKNREDSEKRREASMKCREDSVKCREASVKCREGSVKWFKMAFSCYFGCFWSKMPKCRLFAKNYRVSFFSFFWHTNINKYYINNVMYKTDSKSISYFLTSFKGWFVRFSNSLIKRKKFSKNNYFHIVYGNNRFNRLNETTTHY